MPRRPRFLYLLLVWFVLPATVFGQSASPSEVMVDSVVTDNSESVGRLATDAADGCSCCRPALCTCAQLRAADAAAAGAYKGLFYNNQFDFLCDPCYDGWWPGDALKHRWLADGVRLDIGGQYRARHHSERHHRGLGLTGDNDDFLLHRTRVYGDLHVGDRLRAYAEFIDAESNYENFGPRPIEVNRADLLNLFGDLAVYHGCCGDLWLRVGRQELLYGSQRVVSPLDWSNTRRSFEGYKLFWQGQDWDIDAFYTRPVIVDPTHFDSPDYDQEFMGLYASYRQRPGKTWDAYYLRYNNSSGGEAFRFDTIGGRVQSNAGTWMYDLEAAVQFGDNTDGSNHEAGFVTAGLGRRINCCPWSPTLWVYYDWSSGSNDTAAGNGFHHLFPLAHKYLGFIDLFGRRNLEDVNVSLTMNPTERLQLLVWYHYFFLENRNDTPYSVAMTPFNPANPPASADLGHEIDLLVSYAINARMDILFGYSHFFAGDYYDLTPGVPTNSDADFYYTQFTVNF